MREEKHEFIYVPAAIVALERGRIRHRLCGTPPSDIRRSYNHPLVIASDLQPRHSRNYQSETSEYIGWKRKEGEHVIKPVRVHIKFVRAAAWAQQAAYRNMVPSSHGFVRCGEDHEVVFVVSIRDEQ